MNYKFNVISALLLTGILAFSIPVFALNPTESPAENNTSASASKAPSQSPENEVNEKPQAGKAKSISFDGDIYGVGLYKSRKIPLTVTPDGAGTGKIKWGVGNSSVAKVDANGVVTMKAMGQSALFAITESGIAAVCIVRAALPEEWFIEDVPVICQWDDFPSGCECISTTMLLEYYGYNISPYDFIDNYVPTGYLEEDENGNLFGPDTSSVFIGDPYSEDSLGCYPPVMAYAANKVLNGNNKAVVTTGTSLDSMIDNYIVYNKPVLIWATMYMWEPFVTYEWKVKGAAEYSTYKDGDTCRWIANEHCLVLTGYDKDYYYLNDPNYDYSVRYEKEIFEQRFEEIGRASMAIKGDVGKSLAP